MLSGPPAYGPHYGRPSVKEPWAVQPAPGTPYHRMARTSAQRWWQPVAGTLGIVFAGLALMLVLLLAGFAIEFAMTGEDPSESFGEDDQIFQNQTLDLGFALAVVAAFLPLVPAAAWLAQRRRPGTLSSVTGRLRRRWLLICGVAALGFCAVSFAATWVAGLAVDDPAGGGDWVGWGRFLGPALLIVALVPFQAAAEEYFFRGWLLQSIGSCTLENRRAKLARALSPLFRTPWPAIVISGLLFVSLHGYTGWGILDIFCFGALAGWLAVRTGGLEAPLALHVLNNLMAFLLPASAGELDIEQGDVAWQYVVADVGSMACYAGAVLWLARRLRVRTVTAAAPAP